MTATPEQFLALGNASRALLAHAWARKPRFDLLVSNGLIAVGKTFASDPQASAQLLRHALESAHLKEHGYKELPWLARQIRTIAGSDPDFAIDIYRTAFGFCEESDDSVPMGNSALMALRSNKRQDYQSSWFELSEALPGFLRKDLRLAVRALIAALEGYVARERNHDPYPGEPNEGEFLVGQAVAHFSADWSHSWYRGGYKPLQDAPVLLTKFEVFLFGLAGKEGAATTMARLLMILAAEPSVPAAIWTSLLLAGTQHPDVYAKLLFPLAVAEPLIRSSDSRYQLGGFITAAYPHLENADRVAFERTVLALTGERADRYKAILAGCIPADLVATDEMRTFLADLERTNAGRANAPPFQMTGGARRFGTDEYLASEGVSLAEADNAALREEITKIEALAGNQDLSLSSVRRLLGIIEPIYKSLVKLYPDKVPAKLYEHACGKLAEAAAGLARATPGVLAHATIRSRLKRILLFCATSANPHYNAQHERGFHENLSWGGPSARTAAAEGLMNFTRASKKRDAQVMAAIRKLARDRVPEVRMQIVGNLAMLGALDPSWAWSEIEHVLRKDPTRGLVQHALGALSRLSAQDVPRAIRAEKGVLQRYRNKSGPGMAACRQTAIELIFDLHIWRSHAEADDFAADITAKIVRNAELLRTLVARYSDTLLSGDLQTPAAPNNEPRKKTIVFYQQLTAGAFAEIDERAARLDFARFATWPEADQETVRKMFGILDEIALRLQFAAGGRHDGSSPPDTVSPEHQRLYWEAKPIMAQLAAAIVAPVAHYLIQGLETFIPVDPPGVFSLIAQAIKSAERGGYSNEGMAADLVVRIVKRYLADYRAVFIDRARLEELMDSLDVFVRAGWPAAQSLTFQLGEIWR